MLKVEKKNRRRVVYYNLTYTIFLETCFGLLVQIKGISVPHRNKIQNTMTIYILINTIH